jgi:hypothetical protein
VEFNRWVFGSRTARGERNESERCQIPTYVGTIALYETVPMLLVFLFIQKFTRTAKLHSDYNFMYDLICWRFTGSA